MVAMVSCNVGVQGVCMEVRLHLTTTFDRVRSFHVHGKIKDFRVYLSLNSTSEYDKA